jgi:hypothetical protein
MPLLSVGDAAMFLRKSKSNGWRIYAGVTPDSSSMQRDVPALHTRHQEIQSGQRSTL